MASVIWPTLWRSATTLRVKTVTPWVASLARQCPAGRTTNSESTSTRASAQMSRSGLVSTTWWPRAPGQTSTESASRSKTGTPPTTGPRNRMEAYPRTVWSSLVLPVGSGLTRTVVRRRHPSVSSTSFDHMYLIIDSVHGHSCFVYSWCNACYFYFFFLQINFKASGSQSGTNWH